MSQHNPPVDQASISTYRVGRFASITARSKVPFTTMSRLVQANVAKLVADVEDVVAYGDVDEEGDKDADPDRDVVRIDAHEGPFGVNPTLELSWRQFVSLDWYAESTYDCITKDGSSRITPDADEDEGRDEWATETDEAVDPEVLSEGGRICVVKEDEEDVDSHGKRPPRVRLHEPALLSVSSQW